jgi:hypothetical protein
VEYWRLTQGTTEWNYPKAPDVVPAAGTKFVSGVQYEVIPWTVGGAGTESTGTAKQFIFDNVRPTSTVTRPLNAKYYNSVATISGTSSDDTAQINRVRVWFKDNVANQCWSGSDFEYDPLSEDAWRTPTGKENWTMTGYVSKLQSGRSYTIVSKSWDNATPENDENTFTVSVNSVTFTYDTTKPTSTVTYPINGSMYNSASLTTISGTMTDVVPGAGLATSGISGVKVAIQDLTGATTFWSVALNRWTDSETWNDATIYTTSWTFSVANIGWETGKQYKIRSRAYDNALPTANDQYTDYPQSGYVITFDTTVPVVSIAVPQDKGYYGTGNTLATLSGQAVDYPAAPLVKADVNNVRVAVKEIGGNWWNGTAFSSATIAWRGTELTGSGPYTWKYPGNTGENVPGWTDNKKYEVWTEGFDKAGNTSGVVVSTFTWDETAPLSSIQLPNRVYHKGGELAVLSGTASDGANANKSDVERVEIAIQQDPAGGGSYWSWGT